VKFLTGKRVKRFICILMVVVLLFNFIAPTGIVNEAQAGLGGILLSPISSLLGGIAFAFQAILNGILGLGEIIAGSNPPTESHDLFISDIVYNELAITKANIFDTNTTNANPLFVTNVEDENATGLKGIVSTWYQISRMIALAATLVMLVYVAIQILISSTGQSKAKYMDLLKDWLLCLLLIFTMHYILAAILFISDWVSAFFLSVATTMMNGTDPYKLVMDNTFNFNDFSIIYAIIWLVLLAFTFIIFIAYIKRLILICFIVIISPLVILASTIDKLRGKGGGLLSNMLKEFSTNVIIQPLDALLFTIIISAFTMCMEKNMPLPAVVFIIVFFMLRKWIQKFLGQESGMADDKGSMGMAAAGGAAVMGGANKLAGKLGNMGKGNRTPPKLPTSKGSTPGSGGAAAAAAKSKVPAPVSGASTKKPVGPAGSYTPGLYDGSFDAAMNSTSGSGAGTSSVGSSRGTGSTGTTIGGGSSDKNNLIKREGLLGRGAKATGKALGKGFIKGGVGLAAGTMMAGLNIATGKDAISGFTSGFSTGSSLTGGALKAAGNLKSNISNNGGIKGAAENFVKDKIAGSETLHGKDEAKQYRRERDDANSLADFLDDNDNMNYLIDAAAKLMDEDDREEFETMDQKQKEMKARQVIREQNENEFSRMTGTDYKKEQKILQGIINKEKKIYKQNN